MITMDKKYKYYNGEDARILCIDRPFNGNLVVLSMRQNGAIVQSTIEGRSRYCQGEYDLIEYVEPVYEHHFAVTTSGDTAITKWMTTREAVVAGAEHDVYLLPDEKRERK
jgi:hypothetical protein